MSVNVLVWLFVGLLVGIGVAEVAVRAYEARLRRARQSLDAQGRTRVGM